MISFKRIRRPLATFLLIFFIGQIVAPTVGYALTAGPTAPESSSFEPVDTTDMVDHKTGDFTYSMPLIEIPGPAGGYPLSLSYHAGIQPDQEASWVGLGWTLNPGSISRLVNGYPDDQQGISTLERTFWEGGSTTTSEIGVSFGIANVASVSQSLVFAQDTYRGFGIGTETSLSVGKSFGNKVGSVDLSASMGMGPYGGSYTSVGLSVGVGKSLYGLGGKAKLGLGLSNSSEGWRFAGNGGLSIGGYGMGASISSTGALGYSFMGASGPVGVVNNNSGNISTESNSIALEIPILPTVNLRLGRTYQRYWIDETVGVSTFGSLYIPGGSTDNFSNAFDVYDFLDKDIDVAEHSDPEKVLGGSFPDYDSYTVMGQGVGGNIRPYLFNQELFRQDKSGQEPNEPGPGTHYAVYTKSYQLTSQEGFQKSGFRFVNDFSNRFSYDPGNLSVNSGVVSYEFNENYETGEDGESGFANGVLGGSNHVEWYSNTDIRGETSAKQPFEDGFIDTSSEGFTRPSNASIGGFMITNASGVTYHYALPATSFAEFMMYKRLDEEDVEHRNELTKAAPYAYNWMLTAVTGPNFVDTNENGRADDGDLGYWVNFHYKKYLPDYTWRNPGTGFNKDVDGEFDFYSYGKKELYYLERVNTATHVAVFEKSLRFDGRETSSKAEGGFNASPIYGGECYDNCTSACDALFCEQGDCDEEGLANCKAGCATSCEPIGYSNFPRPTQKLDVVKLYNYSDWSTGRTGDQYLLKKVDFNYSYDLAPGTPNSYDEANYPSGATGKLTLESVETGGKGGVSFLPPLTFGYGVNPAYLNKGFDMWGYYKSDYVQQENENIDRVTTTASAALVHAWSLTDISTPVGAEVHVEYESDVYSEVALSRQRILRTKYITDEAPGKFRITFWENSVDLNDYFEDDQHIAIDIIGSYYNKNSDFDCLAGCAYNESNISPAYDPIIFSDDDVVIDHVDEAGGYIIIEDTDFYNHIKLDDKVVFQRRFIGNTFFAFNLTYTGGQAFPDYFPSGFISLPEKPAFGGGVRVKSLSIIGATETSKTKFEYSNGVTSYEPFQILPPLIIPEYAAVANPIRTKINVKRAMLRNFKDVINIARQIPGPGVTYGSVKMKEEVTSQGETTELPNYSVFEFETYKEGMVDIRKVSSDNYNQAGSYESMDYDVITTAKLTLKDFSSRVGTLKSVTLYNEDGDLPVSKTKSLYAHDGFESYQDNVEEYEPILSSDYNDQGVIDETYVRGRLVLYKKGDRIPYAVKASDADNFLSTDEYRLLAVLNKREQFPVIKIGEENVNYKTGVTTQSLFKKYDYYSGSVVQTLNTDSYNNQYLSVVEPAYRKYTAMGMRVGNAQNKNMLTQTASSKTYKLDLEGDPAGLVSASAQTWSNNIPVLGLQGPLSGIWRMHKSYLWNGAEDVQADGLYPYNNFLLHPFDHQDPDGDDNWQKTSELTLVDVNSHELEARDINGNYAAVRMDPADVRVIASAANSRYDEMAYTGAEYMAGNNVKEGGVDRGVGTPSTSKSHTGKYSLLVGSGQKGFQFTLAEGKADLNKKYKASVWVYVPGEGESQPELNKIKLFYTVNSVTHSMSPVSQKNKSKSWYLLELNIDPNGDEVTIEVGNNSVRGAYFDDFRVHPLDGPMTSFVYDPFTRELTDILDGNNIYTHYEYDVHGRPTKTTREQMNYDFGPGKESFKPDKIQAEIIYNYGKNHN